MIVAVHLSLSSECRMASGVAISSLTLPQVLSSCVLFSMSRAWQLGRAILRARKNHSNVVTTVVEQQQGVLLFAGKVSLPVSMQPISKVCMHGYATPSPLPPLAGTP